MQLRGSCSLRDAGTVKMVMISASVLTVILQESLSAMVLPTIALHRVTPLGSLGSRPF